MKGITTLVSWVRRDPVDGTSHEIKSLNYLNSILAKLEANLSGADEAICLERNGCVAEGVGENIFIVKNGKIYTPPTSTGALEGITSKVVVKLAEKLGYKVSVENLTLFMLFSADEIFFTGTAAEIVPIRQVNWRTNRQWHPRTRNQETHGGVQKSNPRPKAGHKRLRLAKGSLFL